MSVLVDTSVWSLSLRGRPRATVDESVVTALRELIRTGQAAIIGVIRQELLSGVRDAAQFSALRDQLRAFPDLALDTDDFENAAACANRCRAAGVQGSTVDVLICAVAMRRGMQVFTTDKDFARYAAVLEVRLFRLLD